MPPIDIAWVWHLHRLAPLKYAAYCRERFGAVLEPGASAFRLQTERDQASADAEDCARTREAWDRLKGWNTRVRCGSRRSKWRLEHQFQYSSLTMSFDRTARDPMFPEHIL